MRITEEQFECIEHCFPVQRGNVKLSNLAVLNAFLYVAEHGCKWRGLPERFGKWQTVYRRVRRWSRKGVLDEILQALHDAGVIRVSMEVVSLDSTMVKVHPDGTGALKASGPQGIGKSRGGWTTKIHVIAVDDKTALAFKISPGQDHDAPVGRGLIRGLADGPEADRSGRRFLVMDRAYEGDETRELAVETGFTPVVPPKKKNRKHKWEYDKEVYKRRNEIERLFRRLKGYRRVFTRYDKLDVMYTGFITLALIHEALRIA